MWLHRSNVGFGDANGENMRLREKRKASKSGYPYGLRDSDQRADGWAVLLTLSITNGFFHYNNFLEPAAG
jgi:hypothetical protein